MSELPEVVSFVVVVAVVATVGFLLVKDRLYRPMWMVRGAVLSLLLALLGAATSEAVGFGIIGGLLWEILTELASRRQDM